MTVSKPGDQNEVTNRDLLNYVFYSNQSINKSIYRLKKRLSDLQATSPKKEKSQAAPAATRISNCIEAKEEVLRIREAVEGRQALEKEIPTGEELLVLHGDKDATEDQRPGYPLDRIFTYQDLVDAATHAETACQSVEGTATETAN